MRKFVGDDEDKVIVKIISLWISLRAIFVYNYISYKFTRKLGWKFIYNSYKSNVEKETIINNYEFEEKNLGVSQSSYNYNK